MNNLETFDIDELSIIAKEKLKDNPFYLIEQGLLYIIDKSAVKRKLVLNYSQRKVLDIIKREWFANRPVRVYVLKARQQGISTLSEAILFSLALIYDNSSSLVVADKDKNSQHLFDISKNYYDNIISNDDVSYLHTELKKSNAKELKFSNNNSQMIIETAGAKRAGQSFTFQRMHCSEIAYWSNAMQTFTSLNQTIPREPKTIQIIETTANGYGNYACDLWHNINQSDSGYIPVFIAWWEHEEYSMKIFDGEEFVLTTKERELREKYNKMYAVTITDEQFKWARWCLKNNCNGDIHQFMQEYPGSPDEAFIASGLPVFDIETLGVMYEQEKQQASIYRKYSIIDDWGNFKFILGFNGGSEGDFDIYQLPIANFRYMITTDCSEGVAGGDYSVANVFLIKTGEQVCHYSTQVDVDLFTKHVYELAVLYNNAFLAPERNNHGHAQITILENRYHYGNIYKHAADEKLGFPTFNSTRTIAINNLQELLREGYFYFHNLKTINEMMTFSKDKGKMQGQVGCHDDEVTTLWVAAYILKFGLLEQVLTLVQGENAKTFKPFYEQVGLNRLMNKSKLKNGNYY